MRRGKRSEERRGGEENRGMRTRGEAEGGRGGEREGERRGRDQRRKVKSQKRNQNNRNPTYLEAKESKTVGLGAQGLGVRLHLSSLCPQT